MNFTAPTLTDGTTNNAAPVQQAFDDLENILNGNIEAAVNLKENVGSFVVSAGPFDQDDMESNWYSGTPTADGTLTDHSVFSGIIHYVAVQEENDGNYIYNQKHTVGAQTYRDTFTATYETIPVGAMISGLTLRARIYNAIFTNPGYTATLEFVIRRISTGLYYYSAASVVNYTGGWVYVEPGFVARPWGGGWTVADFADIEIGVRTVVEYAELWVDFLEARIETSVMPDGGYVHIPLMGGFNPVNKSIYPKRIQFYYKTDTQLYFALTRKSSADPLNPFVDESAILIQTIPISAEPRIFKFDTFDVADVINAADSWRLLLYNTDAGAVFKIYSVSTGFAAILQTNT